MGCVLFKALMEFSGVDLHIVISKQLKEIELLAHGEMADINICFANFVNRVHWTIDEYETEFKFATDLQPSSQLLYLCHN